MLPGAGKGRHGLQTAGCGSPAGRDMPLSGSYASGKHPFQGKVKQGGENTAGRQGDEP
jgi:hypothetical protein